MPMVIDPREAEVVERRRTKRIEDSRRSRASLDRPGRDRFEQALEFGFGHGSRKNETRKARSFIELYVTAPI